MDAIKRERKKAYEWLVDKPIEHWARFTFDPEVKCPNNTTNFVESFNGKIEKYRYKPIFTMLEAIRRKFMRTIINRAKLANYVKLLLVKAKKESRGCRLTPTSKGAFERLPQDKTPPIEIKRGRLQTERSDITEKIKDFFRSNTLKCSLFKQFGHNKRSHREQGVLQILKGIDKPRPRKEGPLSKKSKTAYQLSSSQSASQTSTVKKHRLRKKALRGMRSFQSKLT
ncbi:hypothetical protein Cgig2_030262 [Carnegiea gigantea]|uniref:Uncharacterized protein n=1 Tax=Carnegiea gigantea TaxID=171969 RepID=A0A9Q1K124_9CARY|nr:hypothetical protein Cgig2_030262 [Carnegiea gigantea]